MGASSPVGLEERLAEDDLPVHRNDREYQRKPLAVAVGPCGSDFGPEAVFALVGDMPGLEGWGFGFVGCCALSACHDEVPFVVS